MGICDQYISARLLDRYPQLYQLGQKGMFFRRHSFWSWVLNGFYHSLLLYVVSELFFLWDGPTGDGKTSGHWVWAEATYTAALATVLGKAALITNQWTKWTVLAIPGSFAVWFVFIGAYGVTQLWIGHFFFTATRFLTTNYLKNGNLEDIAKKLLRRAPRLFVPIVIIFTLEYFTMEMGLLAALQELPSVGYSTWPYTVAPPNFGVYLNDLIQLAYVIPNAIPENVSHYCIGVLWTVPIQLQFTYVIKVKEKLIT